MRFVIRSSIRSAASTTPGRRVVQLALGDVDEEARVEADRCKRALEIVARSGPTAAVSAPPTPPQVVDLEPQLELGLDSDSPAYEARCAGSCSSHPGSDRSRTASPADAHRGRATPHPRTREYPVRHHERVLGEPRIRRSHPAPRRSSSPRIACARTRSREASRAHPAHGPPLNHCRSASTKLISAIGRPQISPASSTSEIKCALGRGVEHLASRVARQGRAVSSNGIGAAVMKIGSTALPESGVRLPHPTPSLTRNNTVFAAHALRDENNTRLLLVTGTTDLKHVARSCTTSTTRDADLDRLRARRCGRPHGWPMSPSTSSARRCGRQEADRSHRNRSSATAVALQRAAIPSS